MRISTILNLPGLCIFTVLSVMVDNFGYGQCCTSGPNLLANYNPHFSEQFPANGPPPGFQCDGQYRQNPVSGGYYYIVNSRAWGACSGTNRQYDHTSGTDTGRFLWFDTPFGASATNPAVAWKPYDPNRPSGSQNTLDVAPNTDYVFSVWVRDLARATDCRTGGAPVVGLRINGADLGQINLGSFTSPCCPEWIQLCRTWNSGNSTSANIQVENRSGAGYTDLGIDDVYFGKLVPLDVNGALGNDTTICGGDTLVLNSPLPNAVNVWNGTDTMVSIKVSSPGTYRLDVFDKGCKGSDTIVVDYGKLPRFSIGDDTTLCLGDTLVLNSPYPHSKNRWSTTDTGRTLFVSSPGTYWLEVDDNNCKGYDTIVVKQETPPLFSIGNDTSVCEGERLLIVPKQTVLSGAPYSYRWHTGSQDSFLVVENSGTVWLDITNRCGTSRDSISIIVEPNPELSLPEDIKVCLSPGDSVDVMVNALPGDIHYSFKWQPSTYLRNDTGSHNRFSAPPGAYKLLVKAVSNLGCRAEDSFNITVLDSKILTVFPSDTVIWYGDQIRLNASGAQWYTWWPANTLDKPGNPNPMAKPLETTKYLVIGTDDRGCLDSAFIDVVVLFQSKLRIPNAFSPNGDGVNDQFKLQGLTFEKLLDFKVFNRFGQLVFQTANPEAGWDGRFNNQDLESGVYFYVISIAMPDGNTQFFKGDVTLLR